MIFEMISFACPSIQGLIIIDSSNLLRLSFLANFHNLKHLCFSGKSETSKNDMLPILRSLEHFNSLTRMQDPELYVGISNPPPGTILRNHATPPV
jgi:hypothetical protein